MVDGDDDALDVEDNQPHVALAVEDVHSQLALVVLEVVEHTLIFFIFFTFFPRFLLRNKFFFRKSLQRV